MSNEGKNAHDGHRFLQKYEGEHGWISVDLDVYPRRRREVRRRGGPVIASCIDEESARAAFRLLAGEAGQAPGPAVGNASKGDE